MLDQFTKVQRSIVWSEYRNEKSVRFKVGWISEPTMDWRGFLEKRFDLASPRRKLRREIVEADLRLIEVFATDVKEAPKTEEQVMSSDRFIHVAYTVARKHVHVALPTLRNVHPSCRLTHHTVAKWVKRSVDCDGRDFLNCEMCLEDERHAI